MKFGETIPTPKPTQLTAESLKLRRQQIQNEIDRLYARVGELDHLIRQLEGSVEPRAFTAFSWSFFPIMTEQEEAAAKERAMKAHAVEVAKSTTEPLEEIINQVEKKNGKPRETYGLVLGLSYNQGQLSRKNLFGWTRARRLSEARANGHIEGIQVRNAWTYKAEDLIAWRDAGEPHKKTKTVKGKK